MINRWIKWIEKGFIPDWLIRIGIRRLLSERLRVETKNDIEDCRENFMTWIDELKRSPIAIHPQAANEQHYEVPARFYDAVLGEHNKYSCCYWDNTTKTLSQAEENALKITCEHAQLEDGHRILELGCGWGSLTLWMAQHYPSAKITAVSNSSSQREFILKKAEQMQLDNIEVITCDMNDFNTEYTFDRVVSVEMFEHMRNWDVLFQKVSNWLNPEGKFFMHVFTHHQVPYAFEVKDSSDWMSQYFFTGGMMPSDDLPLYFQNDLRINHSWVWNGEHYAKTCNAWLSEMDTQRSELMPLFKEVYSSDQASLWWMRWRLFFMACAELFAYENGQQWHVKHYLFDKA